MIDSVKPVVVGAVRAVSGRCWPAKAMPVALTSR
ncbi:MAG: hypothetical protein QOF12_592, partial [Solirubrobacteraceae bacterium]|nr:hypothetical protein [Solirubrobacteraceae bacterium]